MFGIVWLRIESRNRGLPLTQLTRQGDHLPRHFTSPPAFSLVHNSHSLEMLFNTQLASWTILAFLTNDGHHMNAPFGLGVDRQIYPNQIVS